MSPVLDHLDLFWSGFLRSLGIVLWATAGSLVVGTLIAACRVSPLPSLRAFGTAWVTMFRNTPLTVVLYFVAFGLPELAIRSSYYNFGIAALVLYTSAFVCEALRSGINAVPPGQAEAARAIGLPFTDVLRSIVLPQAFRTAIPPLGSVIIAMIKNSAIVGAFGVGGDLWSTYQKLGPGEGLATFPLLVGVAIGFLCMTLPAGALLAVLEKKVAILR